MLNVFRKIAEILIDGILILFFSAELRANQSSVFVGGHASKTLLREHCASTSTNV